MVSYAGHPGSVGEENKIDFLISVTNMAWPGIAAVNSGFANLTAAGMRTTGTLTSAMSRTQAGMLALGGASALALGLVTSAAAKYQEQMALAYSLMEHVTTTQMAQMNTAAKDLAVTFGELPEEVAKGFQRLGRAGVSDVADQITVLRNSIRMAKIEGLSVEESTKILVSTINTFKDGYQNAEKYANVLAHAANMSIATVKDLADSMKYFGSVAREHWSIEETTAAISTLAHSGITGQLAGTSLRSFTNYLIREMPKSTKALKTIGMTFDDFWEHAGKQRTHLKPLQEIIEDMYDASKAHGMGRGELQKLLAQFGEPRMMSQYLKLFPTDEEMENGTWVLAKYNQKMNEGYDIAKRQSTVLATAKSQWDQMISAVTVLGISMGEVLLPPFTLIVSGLKEFANFLAHSKLAVAALTGALLAFTAALVIVVGKWGWGIMAETFESAIATVKTGLSSLLTQLGIEDTFLDHNTEQWEMNAAARAQALGIGGYPIRDSSSWAMQSAVDSAHERKAGRMAAGNGFFGANDAIFDVYASGEAASRVLEMNKMGGVVGTFAPITAKEWMVNAKSVLKTEGIHNSKFQSRDPITGRMGKNKTYEDVDDQKELRGMLFEKSKRHEDNIRKIQNEMKSAKSQRADDETIKEIQDRMDKEILESQLTASTIGDFDNIIGSTKISEEETGWGPRLKKFLGKGKAGATKALFLGGTLGAPTTGIKNITKDLPIIGNLVGGIGGGVARIASFLPAFITGLPLIGVILAGVAVTVGVILSFFKHLDDQIEENTKKIQEYTKKSSELEKTVDSLQSKFSKLQPWDKDYFSIEGQLNKAEKHLDRIYDKIASANRKIYDAKAWQPQNWAEFRKQEGPSWYASAGTSVMGTLNANKWKSGENISKMFGLEGGSKTQGWISGPREQMLSEAYKVENQRQSGIRNLNIAHDKEMQKLDEQHKQGKFGSEKDFQKQHTKLITDYNNKRKTLDTKFDRQSAQIVGPENVDSTRKLYQMEERLKVARLEMVNAIMKTLDVIMKIVMLPLTILEILTGGAFKGDPSAKAAGHTENLNDKINRMTKEMEASAKRIEGFTQALSNFANPILYAVYALSYFVDYIKAWAKWITNPWDWITKETPKFKMENFQDWQKTNASGKDHMRPSHLQDNIFKKTYDSASVALGKIASDIHKLIYGPKENKTQEELRIEEKYKKDSRFTGKKGTAGEAWEQQNSYLDHQTEESATDKIDQQKQLSQQKDQQQGEGYQFRKHSPFTVWKGQAGSLPTGSNFSVKFPELDADVFKKKAVETGQALSAAGGAAGAGAVVIENLVIQTDHDPDKLSAALVTALVNMKRQVTGG